jgi:hypothetical protein
VSKRPCKTVGVTITRTRCEGYIPTKSNSCKKRPREGKREMTEREGKKDRKKERTKGRKIEGEQIECLSFLAYCSSGSKQVT